MKRSTQIAIKYALDRIIAFVLLLATFPLSALVAVAIKCTDRGAVFFSHERLGLRGNRFRFWKFRSMVENADLLLDKEGRASGVNRLTRIGKFLRLSNLDELPQLFNILKGEMSFIGPRPVLVSHWNRYTDEQKKRFGMRPGITGLAQVSGRNTIRWSKRIEWDIEYIENYSFWLDLTILLRTVKVVLCCDGIKLDRNPEEVDDLGPPTRENTTASGLPADRNNEHETG